MSFISAFDVMGPNMIDLFDAQAVFDSSRPVPVPTMG